LEKDQIVLRKPIEKSEVLFHRPWIEAYGRIYPFGLKIRKVLKDPITAGRYLIALNEKENLHLPLPIITRINFYRPLVPPRAGLVRDAEAAERGWFFWRIGERPILQKPQAFSHRYG
jgi:hypothetical protein